MNRMCNDGSILKSVPCLLRNSANSCSKLPPLGVQEYEMWDTTHPILRHFIGPLGVVDIQGNKVDVFLVR